MSLPEAGRLTEAKEVSEKPLFPGGFPWDVEREGKASSGNKGFEFSFARGRSFRVGECASDENSRFDPCFSLLFLL